MSIKTRVEDSLYLWKNERLEGAFLSALVAVASTAKRRYPNLRDREAFELFLKESHSFRIGVEYRGEMHPIEHIFYKWLRCELVHEGGIPVDIEFMPDKDDIGTLSVRAGGYPEYILKLSHNWLHHLIHVVTAAPENSHEFMSPNDESETIS